MKNVHLRSQRVALLKRKKEQRRLLTLQQDIAWSNVENASDYEDAPNDSYVLLERLSAEKFKVLRLAKPGSVLHEVYAIAEKNALDFSFPEKVEDELAAILSQPTSFDRLSDYSHLPFVTIDGEGTMDLDQALYVERAKDSDYKIENDCVYVVWYAIADPSHFIRYGSALYEEALQRGASIYFAGFSAPMLPRALSTGLISLNEGVDRRALLFIMQINEEGKCIKTELLRSKIRSVAKLSNEEVSQYYKSPQNHRLAKQSFTPSLLAFKEVALLRVKEARTRNVVHFNRVSLDVSLDVDRDRFVLGFDERDEVSLYNEQLSLLCNMEGAKFLLQQQSRDPDILAIFRNHEAPSQESLLELEQSIAALCDVHQLSDVWRWERTKQSLSDYLDALPNSTTKHERYYRLRQAIERQILMMQRRSVFSPAAGLHSALGVNPYARFSAPMREIVGIFTHREAIEGLHISPYGLSIEENSKLRTRVIEAANRAKDKQSRISKAIDSAAIARAISRDYKIPKAQRPVRVGTIMGMKSSALYVRLDSPPIELKVYIKDIIEEQKQNYILNEAKTVLQSEDGRVRYVVGQSIGLRVHSYNAKKNKWSVLPA
ncbi:MAG: RNB domain-containing ribonuclease [Bradymonadales bacterium]|jgi:ribonuclease R